jgi:hypothetical protein
MQKVTAGVDCIVIGLESFPMGLSVWVAGNTVYAQIHARAAAQLRCFRENALSNALALN